MNESLPLKLRFGVYVKVPSPFKVTVPFVAFATSEGVSVSLFASESLVSTVTLTEASSATEAESFTATGATFTGPAATVMVTVATFDCAVPSLTR